MHPTISPITAIRPVSVVMSTLILFVASAIANDPPPEIDPLINEMPRVDLFLTPEGPTAQFPPESNEIHRIHPRGTQEVRVTVDKTGTVGNASYQLSGGLDVDTRVDDQPNDILWTVSGPIDEGGQIVQTLTITNTAPDIATATAIISCVWVRQGGGGGAGGALAGTASYEAWLEDSVVDWQFEKEVAIYNLAEHTEEDRHLNFTVFFYDTASRILTAHQISDVEIMAVADPENDDDGEDFKLLSQVTEQLTSASNWIHGLFYPQDPDIGGAGNPGATFNDGSPEYAAAEKLIASLPVDLRVDANRNGLIEFSEENRVQDGRPFKFWLNNDRDVGDDHQAVDEEPNPEELDLHNERIDSLRDLEDFSRIHFRAGELAQMVVGKGFEVSLKFINPSTDQAPSIRMFRASDHENGSTGYLFDHEEAVSQRNHTHGFPGWTIDSDGDDVFPANVFNGLVTGGNKINRHNPDAFFIFEGLQAGTATLAVMVKFPDGPEIEVPMFDISILPVRDMYEHWTVGDNVDTAVSAIPNTSDTAHDSGSYGELEQESQGAIVFVHGWRLRDWERRYFADTAYKRMWQLGFTGEFYHFSWPTEFTERWEGTWLADFLDNPPQDFFSYPSSEQKAYASGAGLLHLLHRLNQRHGAAKVHMFAHSMGNMVASEAIRIHATTTGAGQLLETYSAWQSAMASNAYGEATLRDAPAWRLGGWYSPERYFEHGATSLPYYLPAVDRGPATKAVTNLFCYNNQLDPAMIGWRIGQDIKPHIAQFYFCNHWPSAFYNPAQAKNQFYFSPPAAPTKLLNFIDHTHQIYAWGAQARCEALGFEGNAAFECFGLNQIFSDNSNFTDEHSGQFLSTLALRHEFWRHAMMQFGFPPIQ